jgi:hypothetical protein
MFVNEFIVNFYNELNYPNYLGKLYIFAQSESERICRDFKEHIELGKVENLEQ